MARVARAQRLYLVKVEVFESATNYAYPVVTHLFRGRTREEAWRYHDAHRSADAFLRGCEDHGVFAGTVTCRARITEGWDRGDAVPIP